MSQLGREGRRGQVALRPAAALASEWHRGPLHGREGQGQPCPWEGCQSRVSRRLPSHLSLAAAVASSPWPHTSLLSASCFLLLRQVGRCCCPRRGAAIAPRGKEPCPSGPPGCSEGHLCRAARVTWGGRRAWAVHSQRTLLPAPGSPPPTQAGGSGEDAGLCPHGARTPTPHLAERQARAAASQSGRHDDARPAFRTPAPSHTTGNARPDGSHDVQRCD